MDYSELKHQRPREERNYSFIQLRHRTGTTARYLYEHYVDNHGNILHADTWLHYCKTTFL